MKTHYPNYHSNSKVSFLRKEGDQFASRLMFWGLVLTERLHLMKIAPAGIPCAPEIHISAYLIGRKERYELQKDGSA